MINRGLAVLDRRLPVDRFLNMAVVFRFDSLQVLLAGFRVPGMLRRSANGIDRLAVVPKVREDEPSAEMRGEVLVKQPGSTNGVIVVAHRSEVIDQYTLVRRGPPEAFLVDSFAIPPPSVLEVRARSGNPTGRIDGIGVELLMKKPYRVVECFERPLAEVLLAHHLSAPPRSCPFPCSWSGI